ncbi:MAG: recombinase family protein [Acidimicrobiales bacterium]
MDNALRLAGYIRVSTAAQADAFGPDVQRQQITAWADANGHSVAVWCQDLGVSGTTDTLDRPGTTCVLERIEAGEVDGVIAMTLDRIARALHIQEAFLGVVWQHGARVFTADGGEVERDDPSDPTRTLIRQVLGAVAQFERTTIVNRLQRGRRAKSAAGGFAFGSPAFGQRADAGDLVVDEGEQAIVARIVAAHEAGQSIRSITAALNADGIPSKRGGEWYPATVARVLDRARADVDPAAAERLKRLRRGGASRLAHDRTRR